MLAVCVDEFAGSTILPTSLLAPNDVATPKQQIEIASKRSRGWRFPAITWNHSTNVRQQELGDRKGTKRSQSLLSFRTFWFLTEKREDFGWDLFSFHRHFAKAAGAILLFRFR